MIETREEYKACIRRFYGSCHYFFNAESIEECDRLFLDLMEMFDMCYRYKKEIMQLMIDSDDNPFNKPVQSKLDLK